VPHCPEQKCYSNDSGSATPKTIICYCNTETLPNPAAAITLKFRVAARLKPFQLLL
jgi:hypothetical protein